MPEATKPIAAVEVHYRCDFCDQADVEFSGIVRSFQTPNQHTCPRCKKTICLAEKYPLIRRGESEPKHLDSTDDPTVLKERINLLGTALGEVLIAAKMIRPDVEGMTGPELLSAAHDFCLSCEAVASDDTRNFELTAEAPVEREDGRFYIPVVKFGETVPILRVSTDIFDGDMENKVNRAIEFACDLTARWNRGAC